MKNDKLYFNVGNDHVVFNMFKASKFNSIFHKCYRIDVIDHLIWKEVTNQIYGNPLEYCVLNDGTNKDKNPR